MPAGGAPKGAARPGSAGYVYRHGWVPVAGTGAVDKRSKAKRQATPAAPPNPKAAAAVGNDLPEGMTVITNQGKQSGPPPQAPAPEGMTVISQHTRSVEEVRAMFPRRAAGTSINDGWKVTDRNQRRAIGVYTGVDATAINRGLRGRGPVEDSHREVIAGLDAAFDQVPPLSKGVTVSRSVKRRGPFPEAPPPMSPGAVFEDPGFVSTSKDSGAASMFGRTAIEVRVPAGAKAIDINHTAWSRNSDEEEVLLPRNTRFKVVSDDVTDGKRSIVVEVVP